MSEGWQIALVVVIEIAAVAFLVLKILGAKPRTPRVLRRPDVSAKRLVRKKRDP